MTKRVNSFIRAKRKHSFIDVDFHDLVDMVENGYSSEEIARELGVSKEQIEKLRREINT